MHSYGDKSMIAAVMKRRFSLLLRHVYRGKKRYYEVNNIKRRFFPAAI